MQQGGCREIIGKPQVFEVLAIWVKQVSRFVLQLGPLTPQRASTPSLAALCSQCQGSPSRSFPERSQPPEVCVNRGLSTVPGQPASSPWPAADAGHRFHLPCRLLALGQPVGPRWVSDLLYKSPLLLPETSEQSQDIHCQEKRKVYPRRWCLPALIVAALMLLQSLLEAHWLLCFMKNGTNYIHPLRQGLVGTQGCLEGPPEQGEDSEEGGGSSAWGTKHGSPLTSSLLLDGGQVRGEKETTPKTLCYRHVLTSPRCKPRVHLLCSAGLWSEGPETAEQILPIFSFQSELGSTPGPRRRV